MSVLFNPEDLKKELCGANSIYKALERGKRVFDSDSFLNKLFNSENGFYDFAYKPKERFDESLNCITNDDKDDWTGIENLLDSTFNDDIGMLCFLGMLNNFYESPYFRNKTPVSKNVSGEELSEKIYNAVKNISNSFESLKLKDGVRNTINELVESYFPFIKKAMSKRVFNPRDHVASCLFRGPHYNTPGNMYIIGHVDRE